MIPGDPFSDNEAMDRLMSHVDAGYSLSREVEAARVLLATYADVLAGDDDAAATAVEGETNLHEAVGKALGRLQDCENLSDAIGAHVSALRSRKERFDKQAEALRTAIGIAMEIGKLTKIEHAMGTVSVRAVPPKAVITDEAAVPSKFWKQADPKIDAKALLAALKSDETVPGAMLSNGSTTISVRL